MAAAAAAEVRMKVRRFSEVEFISGLIDVNLSGTISDCERVIQCLLAIFESED